MKIAFYIEDGLQQIVLTPQTKYEEKMLQVLDDPKYELEIKRGAFYDCQGGWKRYGYPHSFHAGFGINEDTVKDDASTILVLREKKKVNT